MTKTTNQLLLLHQILLDNPNATQRDFAILWSNRKKSVSSAQLKSSFKRNLVANIVHNFDANYWLHHPECQS